MKTSILTLLTALSLTACGDRPLEPVNPTSPEIEPVTELSLELLEPCSMPQTLFLEKTIEKTLYDHEHNIEIAPTSPRITFYIHEKIGDSFESYESVSAELIDSQFVLDNGCTYKAVQND